MVCRHCSDAPLSDSYASVCVLGGADLCSSVEALEAHGIVPSLTALCPGCGRVSMLGEPGHALAMWLRLKPFLDGGRAGSDRDAGAAKGP